MTKSLSELEQELADHLNRVKYLEGAIKEAEELAKTLKGEHRQIMGGSNGWGLIKQTEQEIHQVRVALADAKLAHPVLKGYEALEEDYVVSRVTPRCLFIRRVGSDQEDRIILSDSSHYWVRCRGLDIESTIARFEEAKKNGK